ncbi:MULTISPECIES: hypothetical protein [unclassified Nesterenkonia]|uniref:tyrosine-type recombinase/integrase n=1 Tax=unclassified Nesterenkonia TaxID=2629769 RepID=UPI002107492B|nr:MULTISPECIES: hypothetical protein [unclassified Nesterenkonia]
MAHASEAPLLSTIAAEHIARLIDVAPYTRHKYRNHIQHHLPHLDIPVDQITEDDVARWAAWLSNEAQVRGRKTPGYAAKTIHHAHGFLYSVLAYAVKRSYCASNAATDTHLPSTDDGDGGEKFLTAEEAGALLPHIAPKYQPYARFLFATGLRAGELLGLKPEELTAVDGTACVHVLRAMKQDADGVGGARGGTQDEAVTAHPRDRRGDHAARVAAHPGGRPRELRLPRRDDEGDTAVAAEHDRGRPDPGGQGRVLQEVRATHVPPLPRRPHARARVADP